MNVLKFIKSLYGEENKITPKHSEYQREWLGHFAYTPRNMEHFLRIRKLRSSTDIKLYGISPSEEKIAYYQKISWREDYKTWKSFVGERPTHYLVFGYRVKNPHGVATRSLIDDSFNFGIPGLSQDAVVHDLFEHILNVAKNLNSNQKDLLYNNYLARSFWAKVLHGYQKDVLAKVPRLID